MKYQIPKKRPNTFDCLRCNSFSNRIMAEVAIIIIENIETMAAI
ncbi:hypothetical protein AB1A65_00450 [Muricauda sp. ANG21]